MECKIYFRGVSYVEVIYVQDSKLNDEQMPILCNYIAVIRPET